jgi:putative inorganic carbon (hco3(-)) transporter
LNLILKRQRLLRFSAIVLALILSAGAVTGVLLWSAPSVPLLLIGGAGAAALGLFLLQRPFLALYIALFIRLFPIAFGPPLNLAYTVTVNLTVQLALGAWLINTAVRRPIVWNPVCVVIAIYIIWGSVTLFWAPDLVLGATKLVQYITGLTLVFLISNQVRSVKSFDSIMYLLGFIGWMMIVLGLYAMLFTDFHFEGRLKILEGCEETSQWVCNVNNENSLGTILILMTAGAIWPVLRSSGRGRGVYMTLSVVFILCTLVLVAASGSRGSALSMLILLFGFSFWKPVRPWGILGLVLVAGLLAAAPFLLDTLSNRIAEEDGGELGGRDVLWRASMLMMRDVAWTGVGIGNGPFELHKYIASLTSDFDRRVDLPSHNPFLEAGVETGLLGMLLYVSITVCAVWHFFGQRSRSYRRDGALAAYFPLLLCVTAGYLASWIKSGGMENHPTFFVLLALLIIPSQLVHEANVNGLRDSAARGPRWSTPIASHAKLSAT